tara:strand:+ start:5279 stop:5425 length:147 start_codon:yes stop_codon:yes gene_type:complete
MFILRTKNKQKKEDICTLKIKKVDEVINKIMLKKDCLFLCDEFLKTSF